MKKTNIFENIPTKLKEEIFEDIISKKEIKIQRIISKGHTTQKGEWYDQDRDEWVILLKGEAILEFEGSNDVKLQEGDYINIQANIRHRVSWTKLHVETIWLAIYY
ncbi:MAG: cupin [Epsilonproteobacteria bacterium]|nr:MAG: cupin [Campylobacterota bacterium]